MKYKKVNVKKSKAILFLIVFLSFSVFLIAVSFAYKSNNYIELTQLTCNTNMQMMGYFIKTKNNKVIVVDGGTVGDSQNLQYYINNNGGKVDYWFLTHFHTDHTGAIADIIQNTDIEIDNIICNFPSKKMVEEYEDSRISQYDLIQNALESQKTKEKVQVTNAGNEYNIDNVKVKIISVYENDITNNFGNNTSMVFKFYINDKSILFLGDTGTESSEKLLKYHLSDLKSDYVQMAHHGQNGATFELYKAINPTYCFWPTPDWLWENNIGAGYNTGPYKTLETREWMKQLNVKTNYIEKDGNITLRIF